MLVAVRRGCTLGHCSRPDAHAVLPCTLAQRCPGTVPSGPRIRPFQLLTRLRTGNLHELPHAPAGVLSWQLAAGTVGGR